MARREAAVTGVRPDRPAADGEPHGRPSLTERQLHVLLHCLGRGYYEIPRRSTLRALGRELGITATSLSLLLRRAEAKIVQDFGERNGALDARRGMAARPKAR